MCKDLIGYAHFFFGSKRFKLDCEQRRSILCFGMPLWSKPIYLKHMCKTIVGEAKQCVNIRLATRLFFWLEEIQNRLRTKKEHVMFWHALME